MRPFFLGCFPTRERWAEHGPEGTSENSPPVYERDGAVRTHGVPGGTTESHAAQVNFSRPSGTCSAVPVFPALKRRAVFSRLWRDWTIHHVSEGVNRSRVVSSSLCREARDPPPVSPPTPTPAPHLSSDRRAPAARPRPAPAAGPPPPALSADGECADFSPHPA